MTELWDLKSVLEWSTHYLKAQEFSSPRLDAELLLASVLNFQRIELYTKFDRPLTLEERGQFRVLLKRRALGEPVAYILGHKEFMGLRFVVNQDVLIPRPDTEILVEAVLAEMHRNTTKPLRILDIGTGSGCIAISLLAKAGDQDISLEAWDNCPRALAVAQYNANALGVLSGCLTLKCCNALNIDTWNSDATMFDIIVSNPPYIGESEAALLPRDVKDFEPHPALFAAREGLEFYHVITNFAARRLSPMGKMFLEIGAAQGTSVLEICKINGWERASLVKDYGNRDRVVIIDGRADLD